VAATVLVTVSMIETVLSRLLVTYAKGAASAGRALAAMNRASEVQRPQNPLNKAGHLFPLLLSMMILRFGSRLNLFACHQIWMITSSDRFARLPRRKDESISESAGIS
jgi:hypothetical protein